MSTVDQNALVADYLRRLEQAAGPPPKSQRSELVGEIRAHIDEALREDGGDEVAVRNVLERLGPPEEVAAAQIPPRPAGGKLELAAAILIAVPLVGWVLGAVLVAFSRAWTNREKLTGIAICVVPFLVFGLGFALVGSDGGAVPLGEPGEPLPQDDGSGAAELVVVLATFLAGPVAAVYLGTRLRRDPAPRAESA
jgi:HAAS domain-containing protein